MDFVADRIVGVPTVKIEAQMKIGKLFWILKIVYIYRPMDIKKQEEIILLVFFV